MVVDLLKWTFESQTDVIPLANTIAKDYLKEAGRRGFGISPTRVKLREGSGEGSRHMRSKRLARPIDMPVLIFGANRQELEDKFRRLARLTRPVITAGDPILPRLVAEYPNGDRIWTSIAYTGGADPVYGVDTNSRDYVRAAMSFVAPSPYWTEEEAVQYSLGPAVTGRGLIRTGDGGLTRLRLSSSQTIGEFSIENPGDVEAFPIWAIKGPGDSFTATRLSDGRSFNYTAPLLAADVITIDTRTKTVVDQNGVNKYTNLGDAPKLFAVQEGITEVEFELTNTTSVSLVTMYFYPRRELVFG